MPFLRNLLAPMIAQQDGGRRDCPYCGQHIVLHDCPVVATANTAGFGGSGRSRTSASDGIELYDETGPAQIKDSTAPSPAMKIGDYEVLWDPRAAAKKSAQAGWVAKALDHDKDEATALSSYPVERLARRLCPTCQEALPVDLDSRQPHILAVVGVNGAGKTHYLAAALNQATRMQGLASLGIREFSPDDDTAPRLHQDYTVRLFRGGELLRPTEVDDRVRRKPLTFRVQIDNGPPLLIMTHDVSGETFMDYRQRAQVAPFLSRASAVIFLLDPTEFDAIRQQLPAGSLPTAERMIHQGDLLRSCLNELRATPGGEEVPVAVAISKADLVSNLLGIDLSEPTTDLTTWRKEIWQRSDTIRDLLLELNEHSIVQATAGRTKTTFHAVSALGSQPASQGIQAHPMRCLDPLATVLTQLITALIRTTDKQSRNTRRNVDV